MWQGPPFNLAGRHPAIVANLTESFKRQRDLKYPVMGWALLIICLLDSEEPWKGSGSEILPALASLKVQAIIIYPLWLRSLPDLSSAAIGGKRRLQEA